jgi:hypothetical protein
MLLVAIMLIKAGRSTSTTDVPHELAIDFWHTTGSACTSRWR